MNYIIDIKGIEPILAKLEQVKGLKFLKGIMTGALSDVKNWIAVYPPESEANFAGQRRWYQRGYGSRWMRKDGSIGGYKSSRQLGQRWTYKVNADGMGGVVGNNVTYAPFVQGDKQNRWHKMRGWRNTEQAATEMGPKIIDKIKAQIQAWIGG